MFVNIKTKQKAGECGFKNNLENISTWRAATKKNKFIDLLNETKHLSFL